MISRRGLGILFILFITALYYGYVETPRQERVAPGTRRASEGPSPSANERRAAASKPGSGGALPQLRTDLLDRQPQAYTGVQRDLFHSARFVAPLPVIEPEPEEPPEEIVAEVVPVVPPPPPPPTPEELAQKELARFKFLGFFKKGEKRTIFLASGGEIFLVRKGDDFGRQGEFHVTDLTATSLLLRKEGAGEFTIQLVDQAPLSAVSSRPGTLPDGAVPAPHPARPGAARRMPNALRGMPVQPDIEIVPDDQPPAGDQLQPEEEPDETQN